VSVTTDSFALADSASARIQAAQESIPPPSVIDAAHDVFSALADPNRLRLLSCLVTTEELRVSDLAAATDMVESTTSHALRVLRLHGMVTSRREGRKMFYALADSHVRHILVDVLAHVQHGIVDAADHTHGDPKWKSSHSH